MSLRDLILEACEALDPHHQGPQWPDPVVWDGRPLEEQARDLCPLLDSAAESADHIGDTQRATYAAGYIPDAVVLLPLVTGLRGRDERRHMKDLAA